MISLACDGSDGVHWLFSRRAGPMSREQPTSRPEPEMADLEPHALLPRAVRRWLAAAVGMLLALSLYLIAVRGSAIIFDLRDAVNAGQPIDQISVCIIGQRQRVETRADQVGPHDHLGISVGFRHLGRVDIKRQLVRGAADGIAYVVGGAFDVALVGEFDIDARAAGDTCARRRVGSCRCRDRCSPRRSD